MTASSAPVFVAETNEDGDIIAVWKKSGRNPARPVSSASAILNAGPEAEFFGHEPVAFLEWARQL